MGKIAANPYPGARAFQQADYAYFHGRDADSASIADLWLTNRLTILTGPVASGKTSLLLAGVYPLMPAKRTSLLPAGNLLHGMTFPFAALPEHNPLTLALLWSWSPGDIPTRLAGLTVTEFVRRFMQVGEGPVYAAIDQLDAVLLRPPPGVWPSWRQQFLAEVGQALDDHPRFHLLLVARSSALGQLTDAIGGGARYVITGLTPDQTAFAVAKPAKAAGRSYTVEAVTSIVNDLGGTTVSGPRDDGATFMEPSLVQVVCRQLWDDLPAEVTTISNHVLGAFGATDRALTAHCALVIGQVAAERGLTFTTLHEWLRYNFITDDDTRGGAFEGMPATAGQLNAVPRSLTDHHLLTVNAEGSTRCYRLLADRLIRPLKLAQADQSDALTPAQWLAAASRDLALGELDFAQRSAEQVRPSPNPDVPAPTTRQKAQAQSVLANVAYQQRRTADALPHYREAAFLLQASGDTGGAAFQLAAVGQVLLAKGDPASAVTELRAAVERAPSDLGLQTQFAVALWQYGDGAAAARILDWVLKSNGTHSEALRVRGEVLADLGQASSALADLDRAAPDRPSTRAARGLALAELGRHHAATREIDQAMADAQRNGPVLLYAARVLDLAGDKISARERAREAIDATDPPLSPPHRELALRLVGD